MTAKRLVVESAVRDALKEASGLQTISAEAVEWVNAQTAAAAADCAARGRRTPGGRLMAPDGCTAFPQVTTEIAAEPRADGRARPERLCPRAKEFAALSPEQQAEHLHKLYVQAPAVNDEAIDLLTEFGDAWIFGGLRDQLGGDHPLAKIFARSAIVTAAAKGLEP